MERIIFPIPEPTLAKPVAVAMPNARIPVGKVSLANETIKNVFAKRTAAEQTRETEAQGRNTAVKSDTPWNKELTATRKLIELKEQSS